MYFMRPAPLGELAEENHTILLRRIIPVERTTIVARVATLSRMIARHIILEMNSDKPAWDKHSQPYWR